MIKTDNFTVGDNIKVHQKIVEGNKQRIQVFAGTVISIKGRNPNKMFTVRKQVGEIAVERIWPIDSPNIEKVEFVSKPKFKVRRAKLYYLRNNA